jgi:hypothetical protein
MNLKFATERTAGTGKSPEKYLDEISSGFAEMVNAGDHYIRLPSSALPKILKEGRIKSQFETKKSKGGYSKGSPVRRSAEESLFGLDRDIADDKRPIYGYVAGKDFSTVGTHHDVSTHRYGDVVIRLKPEIKDRATVTFMDSIDGSQKVGVPATAASHLGVLPRRMDELHAIGTDKSLDPHQKLAKTQEIIDYIEAQHFGGVRVQDIAEIALPSAPDPKLAKNLEKLGIPHRIIQDRSEDIEWRRKAFKVSDETRKELDSRLPKSLEGW